MSLEAVRAINEAETRAGLTIQKASERSAAIIQDAEKAGRELMASCVARAEKNRIERLQSAEALCVTYAGEREQKTLNEKTALRNALGNRAESAAVFVVEKVVNG